MAPASPASMYGQCGRQRLSATATTSVTAAAASATGWTAPSWLATWRSKAAEPGCVGAVSPSRSGSACTAISTAAPDVNPNSAAGEMKLASEPRRNAPISHCMTPTMTVTTSAIWI